MPDLPGSVVAPTVGSQTAAIRAILFPSTNQVPDSIRIVDIPEPRLHHPSNVLQMVTTAIGIALVLLIAVYARTTTLAVGEDFRQLTGPLATILAIPVNVLAGLLSTIVPLAVLIELAVRRQVRLLAESVGAAIVAFGLALGAAWLITEVGTPSLLEGLSVLDATMETGWRLTIPASLAMISALLIVAGPANRRRSVTWGWRLLLLTVLAVIVTGQVSTAGWALAILLGSLVAHATQYSAGVVSERAYGADLVAAIERAGWQPRALIRIADRGRPGVLGGDGDDSFADTELADGASEVAAFDPREHLEVVSDVIERDEAPPIEQLSSEVPIQAASVAMSSSSDSTATALARSSHTRIYAMLADDGLRYDVEVLDGDRQVPSFMQRLWRVVRLRGVSTRALFTLKAATERTALLSFATAAAGVRTPRLLGVGMASDSTALIFEHLRDAVALRDLPDAVFAGAVGDQLMADAWAQLLKANRAGLAHHRLTPDVILVSPASALQTVAAPQNGGLETGANPVVEAPQRGGLETTTNPTVEPAESQPPTPNVWISGWDQGEIAASQLGKRLDLVQLLALFALRVGPERALAAATAAVPEGELAAIGPLLQTVALPPEIQTAARRKRGLLPEMRRVLADRLPAADVGNQAKIARITPRTVGMLAVTIIAIGVVVTTINFEQIQAAIMGANPWWVGYSIGFSLLTWLGAACTLIAFTPNRLPLGRTVLAQTAGSFVALATPAGIGPAALNMRYLNRKGVATSTALAVVALMQVSQIVVTVLMLLVLSLTTGTGGLVLLPSTTILIALLLVVVAVIVLMLIPPIRVWVWAKIAPTLRQLWPRLSEMLSQPSRLVLGLGGNLLMSLGYVLAFYAALRAFGFSLAIVNTAVIYLVGNTLGALLPTPGGLGGIEGALVAGLSAAGIPVAIATTVTLLFRLVTYWLRIPFGWMAMKSLERRNEI